MKRKDGMPKKSRWPSAGDRFWPNVVVVENCWEWVGNTTAAGYGSLSVNGRATLAHRFAYELLRGPIPPGLQIDHLCRNRNCVNPEHLEPVTQQENLRRGENGTKTHCKHGHPLDGRTSHGRRCLTCHRQRQRRYNTLKAEAACLPC